MGWGFRYFGNKRLQSPHSRFNPWQLPNGLRSKTRFGGESGILLVFDLISKSYSIKSSIPFDVNNFFESISPIPLLISALPTIHLCSPVLRPLEPNRKDPTLPMLLEFVEHNIRLGIDHQFLGFFLDFKSVEFARVQQLLEPYILEGKVSISSMALRGFDGIFFHYANDLV